MRRWYNKFWNKLRVAKFWSMSIWNRWGSKWFFKNSTFGPWNKVGETVYFKYFVYDPLFLKTQIIFYYNRPNDLQKTSFHSHELYLTCNCKLVGFRLSRQIFWSMLGPGSFYSWIFIGVLCHQKSGNENSKEANANLNQTLRKILDIEYK